jgi:hypothetical protein
VRQTLHFLPSYHLLCSLFSSLPAPFQLPSSSLPAPSQLPSSSLLLPFPALTQYDYLECEGHQDFLKSLLVSPYLTFFHDLPLPITFQIYDLLVASPKMETRALVMSIYIQVLMEVCGMDRDEFVTKELWYHAPKDKKVHDKMSLKIFEVSKKHKLFFS